MDAFISYIFLKSVYKGEYKKSFNTILKITYVLFNAKNKISSKRSTCFYEMTTRRHQIYKTSINLTRKKHAVCQMNKFNQQNPISCTARQYRCLGVLETINQSKTMILSQ